MEKNLNIKLDRFEPCKTTHHICYLLYIVIMLLCSADLQFYFKVKLEYSVFKKLELSSYFLK